MKSKTLDEFVDDIVDILPSAISKEDFKSYALQCERYYRAPKQNRDWLKVYQDVENRWYASLDNGVPDYSVYDGWIYLAETWACWKVYSSRYINLCEKLPLSEWNIKSVFDLGNGLGFSTSALADLFPNASVSGTNVPGSLQWKINELYGIDIKEDVDRQTDLIFASEFFEHLYDPIGYLNHVISICQPKVLILANAFSSRSVGHFIDFKDNVSNKKMGRLFNKRLRSMGYSAYKTGFWNSRPAVWTLDKRVSLFS